MPSLQIRNLPDDLNRALAERAERAHRSLAQQALVELRSMTENTDAGRRRQVSRAIKERLEREQARLPDITPEALIRDDRDR